MNNTIVTKLTKSLTRGLGKGVRMTEVDRYYAIKFTEKATLIGHRNSLRNLHLEPKTVAKGRQTAVFQEETDSTLFVERKGDSVNYYLVKPIVS